MRIEKDEAVETLSTVLGEYDVKYFTSENIDLKEVLTVMVDEGKVPKELIEKCNEQLNTKKVDKSAI